MQHRFLFLPVLAVLAAFGPLSIDMYLPSLPAIGRELGAGPGHVQLTLSMFFVGACIGQLTYGPLSDRYGRKPMLLIGVSTYVAASAVLATAGDIGTMVVGRFLQALGGGAATVIARAAARDRFEGIEAARALSTLMLIMGAAPLLAPSLGALILKFADWRAIFWVLAAYGALALLAVVLLLPETRPRELRPRTGLWRVFRNYGEVLSDPVAATCAVASAGAFAGMFAYISGTPFVYIELFGLDPETYGLLFALNVVAIMGGAWANRRLVAGIGVGRMMTVGVCIVSGSGLALVAAVLLLPGSLAAVIVLLFCFLSGLNLISANAIVCATADRPALAGTTIAFIGAAHFGLGSLAGLAVGQAHDGTALPMAATMAVCGLTALAAERRLASLLRR